MDVNLQVSASSEKRNAVTPRIACVGVGHWGKNLARNFQDLGALHTICEVNAETRSKLSEQYPCAAISGSVVDVLRDKKVQGVAIATPAASHAALAREALMAGKDVFVEKPLGMSPQEGEALVALASQKQCILMVGHLLWYHPAVLKLKELIQKGELGRIQYIYSNRLNLGKIRREENILWSFAPHDISVILGLLNEMPEIVQAQGGNYLHQNIPDVTVSLLSFPSGAKAHIFVSWLHPVKEQKLVVVGDRKMAVFDDMEQSDKLVVFPHTITWHNQVPVVNKAMGESVPFDFVEPLRAECLHFLECIQTRGRPRTDGEEGIRVLKVLQECQKALDSAPRGKPTSPAPAKRTWFAHESAFIEEEVEIGDGTTIWHVSHILKGSRVGKNCRIGQNVVIGPNVTIGNGVKIQNNVSVYEGVTLEDSVFCGPSMVFTNVLNPRSEIPRMHELRSTLVKRGASLGANCTVLCGTTIGKYAFVGAGAVVTKDVPDYALVLGNPARLKGWMCACGIKLVVNASEASCPTCRQKYHLENGRIEPINQESRGEPLG